MQRDDGRDDSKRQLVGAVTLQNGETVPIEVNEDEDEIQQRFDEPVIYQNPDEFDEEELKASMKKEMDSLRAFDVFDEVSKEESLSTDSAQILDLRWVHVWKGFIKSRLCIRGFTQKISDLDLTYASTPVVMIFRVLLVMALAMGWSIQFCDVSTAFLHAPLQSETPIYVIPPREFYPDSTIRWRLKKAMYGLRSSPADWQSCMRRFNPRHPIYVIPPREFYPDSTIRWRLKKARMYGLRSSPADWQSFFAKVLQDQGFQRCQSDAGVYFSKTRRVYILVYVDDLMVIGPTTAVQDVLKLLHQSFLLKETDNLDKDGSTATFLGRILRREGDSIQFQMKDKYLDDDFKRFNLERCKPAPVPGLISSKVIEDSEEPLSASDHQYYRQVVGRLQWLTPIRPDLCFSVKELARSLSSPTTADFEKVKHILRYLRGTLHYRFTLHPQFRLADSVSNTELDTFADSDWAGCQKTRRSTSGFIIFLLGTPVHFGSRTQAVHALSSAEAELYAMGSAVSESLHIKHFLEETALFRKASIIIRTDSSAGKSMASRFGTSKRTRHVQLRFLFLQHLVSDGQIQIRKVLGRDIVLMCSPSTSPPPFFNHIFNPLGCLHSRFIIAFLQFWLRLHANFKLRLRP